MNYTNLFGTLTAFVGIVYGFLKSIGCLEGPTDFAATCNVSWLPVSWLPYLGLVFGAVVFVGKYTRPGSKFASFFGKTAVIVKPEDAKVGVVTPAQVAAPK